MQNFAKYHLISQLCRKCILSWVSRTDSIRCHFGAFKFIFNFGIICSSVETRGCVLLMPLLADLIKVYSQGKTYTWLLLNFNKILILGAFNTLRCLFARKLLFKVSMKAHIEFIYPCPFSTSVYVRYYLNRAVLIA
jgi:hypothetical protein